MHADIRALAETQHGIVGRRQLLARGFSRAHIDALVRRGHLVRVSRGTYRVSGSPMTPLAELMAAALRCGPDARVVGERLLALVGVHTARVDGPFTVLTRPGRTVTGVDWSWRSTDPAEEVSRDAAIVVGVPSVTPARNLLEAAVDCADRRLERLIDGCRWTGRLDRAVRLAVDSPRHPGAVRLLASGLVDVDAAESGAERDIDRALAGLGAERQVWVTPAMRVDFLFRDAGLVLERDPDATHGGPTGRRTRRARRAALASLGLVLESITDEDAQDLPALRTRVIELLAALGDRQHMLLAAPSSQSL